MLCLIRQETPPPPPLRFSPSSPLLSSQQSQSSLLARQLACLGLGVAVHQREGIERRCWTEEGAKRASLVSGSIETGESPPPPPPPLLQGFVCGVRPPSFPWSSGSADREEAQSKQRSRGVWRAEVKGPSGKFALFLGGGGLLSHSNHVSRSFFP